MRLTIDMGDGGPLVRFFVGPDGNLVKIENIDGPVLLSGVVYPDAEAVRRALIPPQPDDRTG